jgi:hypothetical protein
LIVTASAILAWRSAYLQTLLTGEPAEISMTNLISDPLRYHGVRVRLIGYARLEFEGDRLCATREASLIGDSRSCVWLDRPPGVNGSVDHFAIVEGVYSASEHGHMGMFAGALTKVNRFDLWYGMGTNKAKSAGPTFNDRGRTPPVEALECRKQGGKIRAVGHMEACAVPFADAGKTCTDNSECRGACILDDDPKRGPPPYRNASGTCQRENIQLGCYGEVNGGGVERIECHDVM